MILMDGCSGLIQLSACVNLGGQRKVTYTLCLFIGIIYWDVEGCYLEVLA